MAGKGKPVSIVLDASYNDKDLNKAIKDLERLKTGGKNTNPVMGGLTKAMGGLMGAFAAGAVIGKVADFLQDAAKAAMEDEASAKKLETAMRNLNAIGDLPAVEAGIDKMSRSAGVADDELRPAFQKLMQATGDAETAQAALQTALDISAGTGRDLGSVSQALSRAYLGNASALKRLGVPLDDQLVKSKDMVAIQAQLNKTFGGQASAAAGTYSGQMRKMTVAVDEAKEAVGYALLNAIENVSNELGGTGGATSAIDQFGQAAAGLVTSIGSGATEVSKLIGYVTSLGQQSETSATPLLDLADKVAMLDPTHISQFMLAWTRNGIAANDSQQELNASLRASEGYYQSYINSVGPAAEKTRTLAAEQEDAADATDALKDAFFRMDQALAKTMSYIEFRKSLNEISKELKDGKTQITGYGDTALANQSLIVSVFQNAQKAAEGWVKATGRTDELAAKYNEFARQARRALIANGINKKDLDEFLGKNNMWQGKLDSIVVKFKSLPAKVHDIGLSIGVELADGTTKGIIIGTPSASQAAIDMIKDAERAARKEAKSQSPSKKFAELGKDLVKGTIKGIRDEIKNRRQELNSMYQEWYGDQMSALEDAKSTAKENYDNYERDIVQPLRDALEKAKQSMESFRSGVKDTLTGAVSFRDLVATDAVVDDEGNTTKAATTFMENLRAQATKAVEFANKIKTLVTAGLSEAGIQQVLAAGADAGGKIADELIKGGATAITETNALMDSVSTAATTTADAAATTFYQAGVDVATSLLDGADDALGPEGIFGKALAQAETNIKEFVDKYGPGGTAGFGKFFDAAPTMKGFTAAVADFKDFKGDAKDLIKKKKKDKEKDKGKKGKAAGGNVFGGTPYTVGERGPELFVPGMNGAIIPNNRIAGGGINITVNAGMGADGAVIGEQIVQAIKKYERRSGPVFTPAA